MDNLDTVTVCIVGLGKWEEYTLPLIKSIQEHEPRAKIVVLDNGSDPPYPMLPYVYRRSTNIGYADGINLAVEIAGECDWYLVINNDVLVQGQFVKKITKRGDKTILYGIDKNSNTQIGEYIEGWFFLISSHIWQAVGEFDPAFIVAGYEDVDYSYRAKKAGMGIAKIELPFKHFGNVTRGEIEGYSEIRKANLIYFKEKFNG